MLLIALTSSPPSPPCSPPPPTLSLLIFFLSLPHPVCSIPQSCPTLCDPMDCSLLASSVHGISQARILEWVAVSYSRHSSQPRDRTYISYVSCLLKWILCHLESPLTTEDDLTMSPG